MKFTLFLMISIFCANLSFAQSQEHKGKEINFLVEKFSLNTRQQGEAINVVDRKYKAFAEIQKYKTTAPKKYASKVQALYEGTLISVGLIPENETQREALRQYRIELRKQKAKLMKKYKQNGLSTEEAIAKYYSEVIFS